MVYIINPLWSNLWSPNNNSLLSICIGVFIILHSAHASFKTANEDIFLSDQKLLVWLWVAEN